MVALPGLASLPRGVFESLPRLAQLELRDNLLQEPVTRFSRVGFLRGNKSEHEAGFYTMRLYVSSNLWLMSVYLEDF